MVSRRFFFALILIGLASPYCNALFAQTAEATLTADVLIQTLYAKTAAEKKYCEDVVTARDAKILPTRIFYAAYRYAMKKEKGQRFTYFQTVLTKLCKDEGITLAATTPKKTAYNPFSFFLNPFK